MQTGFFSIVHPRPEDQKLPRFRPLIAAPQTEALRLVDSENKHLKFYTEHKIAHVEQFAALERMLNYRRSLYEQLGLHSLAVRGPDDLGMACGTGKNSVFVA